MALPNQPNHSSLGEKLRSLRESRRLDLKKVHEATKIPLDVLKAIEEGYTIRMISPFYFKGFTKMYAQYLDVDLKELEGKPKEVDSVEEKEEPQPQQEKGPIIKETKRKIRFTSDSTKEFISRKKQKQIVQVVGVLLLIFIVFRMGGCILSILPKEDKSTKTNKELKKSEELSEKQKDKMLAVKPKKDVKKLAVAKAKKEEPAKKIATLDKKKEIKQAPKPQPVAEKKQKETKVEPKTEQKLEKVKLVIKSKKRGWLQVKVDGKVVFQSTIKEGITEKWEANKTIEISGKSIHYLDFEVNGKKLGPLSSAYRNSRRVLITKDGLSVKQ